MMKQNSRIHIIVALTGFSLFGCQQKMSNLSYDPSSSYTAPVNQASNTSPVLTCKLSPKQMHKRKLIVLASLKKQVIERKELPNGYAFRFTGSDQVLDELTEFIKTERTCCDFFTFNLSISGDKSEIWLELTGVEGAKEFITSELEL